jgi:hypothetical protein
MHKGYGYCSNCKEHVLVDIEDYGLGKTEFWGSVSTHHDYRAVCSQCEEELEDWEEDEPEYERDYD